MQKMIIFIEPGIQPEDSTALDGISSTPGKIGRLFMNRFAVDENSKVEVLRIFELEDAQCHHFQENWDPDLGIDRKSTN